MSGKLYIIGLGLCDTQDITLRGLNYIKTCGVLFLEAYTSILSNSISAPQLKEFYSTQGYNGEIKVADRNLVESEADQITSPCLKGDNVGLLIVGDPVCATTHTDIMIRAREQGIEVVVVHNASVMGAVGSCGLQLYNYGQTVSIPFFEENWRPYSFYEKIMYNRKGGMHTLCLLDIKTKEPNFEDMKRGKTSFLPPRFMTCNTCISQLLEAEENKKEGCYDGDETLCVGMARLGCGDLQCIKAGSMNELANCDFGEPLHCFVVCGGEVHDLELEALRPYIVQGSRFAK